jgi:hypothetical protein
MHDSLLSDQFRTQLASELTDAVHAKGPAGAVMQPAAYSPLLSSLELHYKFPYHGVLKYTTTQPYAQLNHMVVALATGDLVPQDTLASDLCAELPAVQVPSALMYESQLPTVLTLFLKDFKNVITERFACEWRDADSCFYHDRDHVQYSLVADGKKPITEADIKLYDATLKEFKPERTAKEWVVDIRFKGQVVITPDGGV